LKKPWYAAALALALLTVGTGYWGYSQYLQKKQMETYLTNRNQKAFFELVDHVENMEVLLAKSMVANSPRQNMMVLSDIWLQANSAQEDLGLLPVSHGSLARTAKFIGQVGDYAFSLAKKNARGIPVKSGDWDKLAKLHTEAGVLGAELQRIQGEAGDGRLTWREVSQETRAGINKANKQLTSERFVRIDKQMQEYPTLIYDGPFSDHIERRRPLGLTGKQINAGEAAKIALDFTAAASGKKYSVTGTSTVNGIIPAFRVNLLPTGGRGEAVLVDVSRQGGHVVWMLNTRPIGRNRVVMDAAERAGQFLISHGKANMEATYALDLRNMAVISFAYKQDKVLVYPDLIKVQVALDSGEIVGYEAMGYLMSHTVRKLPKPKISADEARRAVNPRLNITHTRLTLIPLETLQEVLCYEIKGTLNSDPFIIYINALTGEEERILQVIETRNGPMTM